MAMPFAGFYLKYFVTIQPSCPNAFIGHPLAGSMVDSR
jgi:hypothetical protein